MKAKSKKKKIILFTLLALIDALNSGTDFETAYGKP